MTAPNECETVLNHTDSDIPICALFGDLTVYIFAELYLIIGLFELFLTFKTRNDYLLMINETILEM